MYIPTSYKTLMMVGAVFFCLLLLSGRAVADGKGITAHDLAKVDDGRDIYMANCAACHGFDGTPIMAGVPVFSKGERMEKSDAELLKSINNGKQPPAPAPPMPPWKESLSAEEQQRVLTYVRVMEGDVVFADYCSSCHGSNVPPLSDAIPKSEKEMRHHSGPIVVCNHPDSGDLLNEEETISVVKFLRTIAAR
ncbi:MAG: c-type cytochrome [Gammaproteobacteria bacterium]|nr:c-type cytochrome [Gammaproteobacteria bacterium]